MRCWRSPAIAGFFSRRAARSVLRAASFITLVDAGVGFYFHIRGIHRKPGGWRLPMTNMIMGPPIFAPLLFGTSAYLGLIASYLQREDGRRLTAARAPAADHWLARVSCPHAAGRDLISTEQDIREGKFQRQVAIVAGISALLSGFEAYYSHYKNNFRYKIQWSPVVIAPLLAGCSVSIGKEARVATTALPALSAVAGADAAVGFYLPCTRRASPARRTQASALQHHVRAAYLCSAALRCSGHARAACQLASAREG